MSLPTVKSVKKSYRRYAPAYWWVFGAILEPGRILLADTVTKLKPASLLEIGVGTGLLLARYPANVRVVGVDISTDMLAVAQERANALTEHNIQLLALNAEMLDFPDNSFDCVTLPYVLSVTPHPQKLVAEVQRVCRKDGTILVVNHFSGSWFWWALERLVSPWADKIGFSSIFDFEEQILRHSWSVTSVTSTNLLGLSKFVVIRNSK